MTEIHDNALMDFLPQVSPEDLNEGDLQSGDLAVHEDSSQIKLHLETDVDLKEERHFHDSSFFLRITLFNPIYARGCTNVGSVDGG